MNTTEITNGNKLIAEFMRLSQIVETDGICFRDTNAKDIHEIKYNSSWDWLMPVVEKIDSMGYNVQISRISCKISKILETEKPIISLACGDISQKIELCFTSIISFLEWYNKNK